MSGARSTLLLSILLAPLHVLGQAAGTKTMVYYDSQSRRLPAAAGAAWAVETKYLDSVRAVERVYFAPQKVGEQASFANIRLRQRDGETVVYYEDGTVRRREQFRDGHRQGEGVVYYPNGKLRRHTKFGSRKLILQECFDPLGNRLSYDTLDRHPNCPDRAVASTQTHPNLLSGQGVEAGH